jgi:hypothetical protein
MLYNPVNMKIEDEKRLYERDLREKNKKRRFEVKYDVEYDAHIRGLQEESRQSAIALNKVSYNRFLETTDRGFDILTNDQLFAANSTKQVHKPHA